MNFYPKHVGDFIKDTVGLTLAEVGAHNRLLDQYYGQELPIPHDERYRITGVSSAKDKRAVDYVLGKFFIQEIGSVTVWRNKRADQEIDLYKEKSAKAAASVNVRWNKRNTNVLRTNYEGNTNQEPVTNNHKPEGQKQKARAPAAPDALPDWMPQPSWQEWRKHRGQKVTPLAAVRQIAKLDELRRAGFDPASLISLAIESGWATFYPPRGTQQQQPKRAETASAIYGDSSGKRPDDRDITADCERVA